MKYRLEISRKEAKECMLFLGLIKIFGSLELESERSVLVNEALKLRKILSAMIKKLDDNNS